MKKVLIYNIPILNIILLLVLWINIELDVKFKLGSEKATEIYNEGQELAKRSSVFIMISILFNLITLLVIYLLNREKKVEVEENILELKKRVSKKLLENPLKSLSLPSVDGKFSPL